MKAIANNPLAMKQLYEFGKILAASGVYRGASKLQSNLKKSKSSSSRSYPYKSVYNSKSKRRPRRKTKPCVDVKARKQVRKLKRLAESDMGTHIQRVRDVDRQLSAVNAKAHGGIVATSITTLEAVIAELRYYNPSAPTTLVNASGATGSYQKEFFFEKVYSKITIRNNYQLPCKVACFACVPKEDTSITPNNAYTSGLADVGNPSSTCPLVYLTDSPQFKDLWAIKTSKKEYLMPGQELVLSYDCGSFQYDPSLADSHSQAYQERYRNLVWHFTNEGILSHDTVADEQGISESGIDVICDTTYVVKYAAGADIKYIVCTDNSDTFTNGATASNQPVSDNQQYSVA